MANERVFANLVICDIALNIAGLAFGGEAPPRGLLLGGLWLLVVVATIVAWAGLLARIREARAVYLGAWIGYLVVLALGGPVTTGAGDYALQMLMAITGGAVLAAAFLPGMRGMFHPLLSVGAGATPAPGAGHPAAGAQG